MEIRKSDPKMESGWIYASEVDDLLHFGYFSDRAPEGLRAGVSPLTRLILKRYSTHELGALPGCA